MMILPLTGSSSTRLAATLSEREATAATVPSSMAQGTSWGRGKAPDWCLFPVSPLPPRLRSAWRLPTPRASTTAAPSRVLGVFDVPQPRQHARQGRAGCMRATCPTPGSGASPSLHTQGWPKVFVRLHVGFDASWTFLNLASARQAPLKHAYAVSSGRLDRARFPGSAYSS